MGPFCVTRSNATHQLSDPTQPNPTHGSTQPKDNSVVTGDRCHSATPGLLSSRLGRAKTDEQTPHCLSYFTAENHVRLLLTGDADVSRPGWSRDQILSRCRCRFHLGLRTLRLGRPGVRSQPAICTPRFRSRPVSTQTIAVLVSRKLCSRSTTPPLTDLPDCAIDRTFSRRFRTRSHDKQEDVEECDAMVTGCWRLGWPAR